MSVLATRYLDNLSKPLKNLEEHIEHAVASRVRSRKFLDKESLYKIAKWKSPRSARWVQDNEEDYIKQITSISLSTSNERLRIESLTLITGVYWPTASVILHFTHKKPYPILDFRALWSLGISPPPSSYKFDFWWKYVKHCRMLSEKWSCSMRTLDRALWQYSKEKQISSS